LDPCGGPFTASLTNFSFSRWHFTLFGSLAS